ncbi:MAG: cellulose binding domain-containing protein, partial [Porcipelethomonas sp.]
AHVLYGALVGGPNQNGQYNDVVSSYENSEVAIDYNAGYTAALCGLIEKNGGTSDPDFPPVETPKWDEFYIEACINQASSNFTELKVQATNHSAWPARVIKNLSYRYYMDLTELFEAGYTSDDLTVKIGQDEFQNCTISEPKHYGDNIYYVEITYADGTFIAPTGQSEHQGEVQFRISAPDATNFWNPDNDYSFEGLVNQDVAVTDKITMYDNGKLIWGKEPYAENIEPTEVPPVTEVPTTAPSGSDVTEETLGEASCYGDVDCNGTIEIADVVTLNLSLLDSDNYPLSSESMANADVEKDNVVNMADSGKIINYLAKIIPQSDLGK